MTLAQGLLAEGQKRKYVPRYSPCYQKKRKHSDVSGRKKFHVSSYTETPSFYPSSYQTMSLARKQNYRIQYTGNLWLFCLPLLLKSLLPLKQLVCFSLFHLCHHLSLCSRPSLTRLQLTTQFGAWHPLGSICQFSWHTATTWMLAVPKPACSSHRIQNPPVTTLSVPWRKCPLFRGVCRVHIVFTVPPHSSPSNPTTLSHQCSDCITLLAASPWLTAFPLLKSLPTHPYLNSPLSSSSLLLWSGFPNNLGSCFFLLTVLLPRLMDVCSVDLWKFLRPFGEGGMSWGHTHSYNNTKMWFIFLPVFTSAMTGVQVKVRRAFALPAS